MADRSLLFLALASAPVASGILLSSYASFLVDSPPLSRAVRPSETVAGPPAVELFSTVGCGWCSRAKRRLQQLAVPFAEVDVGSSVEMRVRMTQRAGGRTTVPQIFIGGNLLGGFNELDAAEASGALRQLLEPLGIEPLARRADSQDRLADPEPAAGDIRHLMPQGGLLNHLPISIAAPTHLPGPLFPAAGSAAPVPTAAQLSASLQRQILTLYDEFVTPDGTGVSYARLKASPAFDAYARATALLRPRLAFWINVYNALVIHGAATVGFPADATQRAAFFSGQTGVAYSVGGLVLSLDDIEHGILRGSPPGDVRSFATADPRAALSVPRDEVDPRIHFALNCGARGCPPIQIYDSDNVEVGLALAASSFLEAEVRLNVAERTVHLSKLLQWYGSDFGGSERQMLARLAALLPEAHPTTVGLGALLADEAPFHVTYAEYDWAVNAA